MGGLRDLGLPGLVLVEPAPDLDLECVAGRESEIVLGGFVQHFHHRREPVAAPPELLDGIRSPHCPALELVACHRHRRGVDPALVPGMHPRLMVKRKVPVELEQHRRRLVPPLQVTLIELRDPNGAVRPASHHLEEDRPEHVLQARVVAGRAAEHFERH